MRAPSRFFVVYNCPNCGVALEADDDGWDGWRRCPSCGRPALPPKVDARRRSYALDLDAQAPRPEGDPGADGTPGSNGSNPASIFQIPGPSSPVIGPARLIFKTGFILSLALLLISYLDQKSTNTAIFGALAFVFFLLLLRLPRKRRIRELPPP
jgi:hypothetical protein